VVVIAVGRVGKRSRGPVFDSDRSSVDTGDTDSMGGSSVGGDRGLGCMFCTLLFSLRGSDLFGVVKSTC
jgi:hypothetical protein